MQEGDIYRTGGGRDRHCGRKQGGDEEHDPFHAAPPSGFETALQRGLHEQSLEREVDEKHWQRYQG